MNLARVIDRWGPYCVYCRREATTRDHLIPKSRGGKNTLENLRPACAPCNTRKADKTPLEWLGEDCPEEFRMIFAVQRRVPDWEREQTLGFVLVCYSCGYKHPKPRTKCVNCGYKSALSLIRGDD